MNTRAWLKLLFDNRRSIVSLTKEGLWTWRQARRRNRREAKLIARLEREGPTEASVRE
jgi:hypothetical protein